MNLRFLNKLIKRYLPNDIKLAIRIQIRNDNNEGIQDEMFRQMIRLTYPRNRRVK